MADPIPPSTQEPVKQEPAAAPLPTPAVAPAAPQTETVENIPIFATGVWNGIEIKPENLDSMVDSFEKLKDRLSPPLKLGHNDKQEMAKDSGLPSMGWISSIKRMGDQIVGTFTNVPKVVADLIRKKAYRFVSPEVLPSYKYNGEEYPWTLWGVAILGNQVPAIKSLGDISTLFGAQPDNFSALVLRFSESSEGVLLMVPEKKEPVPVTIVPPLNITKAGLQLAAAVKRFGSLKGGYSKPTISKNIGEMINAGKSKEQAAAIALSKAREAAKEAGVKRAHLKKLAMALMPVFKKQNFDGGNESPPAAAPQSEYHQPAAMPGFAIQEGFNQSKPHRKRIGQRLCDSFLGKERKV